MEPALRRSLESIRANLARDASQFNIEVGPWLLGKLLVYCELLLRWNRKVNLISFATIPELVRLHLLEALYLTHFLRAGGGGIIDVGSGGGIPGIPLSIALPKQKIQLVEVSHRKSVFLEEVARCLELENLTVTCGRYTKLDSQSDGTVTARALEHMSEEIPQMLGHFQKAEQFLFLIGAGVAKGLEIDPGSWSRILRKIPLSRNRYLLEIVRRCST